MHFQWSKTLAQDEILQKEFTISARYRTIIVALIIVCGLGVATQAIYIGILIFVLGYVYWFYLKNAKHYAFTDKRVILVESFIGKNSISIDYNQITDIEIEQNAFDEFGGWGTLTINTAGTHVPEVHLSFIDNPQAIKQSLDQIRDKKKTP